jgi:hypothetical protein
VVVGRPSSVLTYSTARVAPTARPSYRWLALSIVGLGVLATPVAAKRRPSTQIDSSYGPHGSTSGWELHHGPQVVDGLTLNTQTVCPSPEGGIDNDDHTLCHNSYVFIYQLPPGLSNVVLTFDGLTGFGFGSGSFGVLLCMGDPRDDAADEGMFCTKTSTADYSEALGLEFGASAGRLTLFVPTVRAGEPLTFYIREVPPNPPAKLAPPRLSIGHAVIYPSSLRFGSQEVGTVSAPQTIAVSSWSSPAPPLGALQTMTPAAFPVSGTCGALDPGTSCVLQARFAPTNSDGSATGAFQLLAGGTTTSIPVTGQVTTQGLTITPSTLTFGSQVLGTSSTSQTVTISRTASATEALTISEIAIEPNAVTGAPDFTIAGDHCTGVLAPGDSCRFAVMFAPQYPGALTARATVADGSGAGHLLALAGTANDPGTATLSVSDVVFGSQPIGTASAHRHVRLTRPTAVVVDVTPPFALVAENCTSVTASASCDAEIAFTPPLVGPFTGALTFATDAVNGTQVIPLTGSGSDVMVAVAPSTAAVARGTATRFVVTVASQGGFSDEVTATCSGAPAESTCQAASAAGLLAADGTLMFAFEIATASGTAPALGMLGGARGALLVLAALAVAWRLARSPRRRMLRAVLAARLLSVAACCALGSCATSHPEGDTSAGTPTGRFPLSFRIASGTVVRTATATLIVQ